MKKIVFAIVVGIVVCGCGGPVSNNTKEAAQLAQDSTALVALFNKEIKVGDNVLVPIPTEIVKFDNRTCRLYVKMPEDRRGSGAESLGTKKCTEAVKWLSENGYDVGSLGVFVTCHVYSPAGTGVTGTELVAKWGSAHYDFNNDIVVWKPAK